MLRFLTAGESHGKALLAILEGMPAGLRLNLGRINAEMKRRQMGVGRGPRMGFEKDKVRLISGIRKGMTIGSPIGICIENKDFSIDKLAAISNPRPGHADLAGSIKYAFTDIRNVLERASARETAARVAVGAVCKVFLDASKVDISSAVISIGGAIENSDILKKIAQAREDKDTLGGIFTVTAEGLPVGLGSYVHWDRRLDGRIAQAILSIPGIKAVEFGLGFGYADRFGSEVHDAIYFSKPKGYTRKTNNAGGLEGGMTNGEPLIIRACMKPIATLGAPLDSVDIRTKRPTKATIQRADICAVGAAGVIAEAMVAYILTDAFLEKFGCDSLRDIKSSYPSYKK